MSSLHFPHRIPPQSRFAHRPALELLAAVVLAAALALCLHPRLVSGDLYAYDEADYMSAAEKGFCIHYLDYSSIPLTTFIDMGTRKGMNKREGGSLSEYIRGTGDVAFLRHYHVPLAFYAMTVAAALFPGRERAVRFFQLAFLLATAVLLVLGMRVLLPDGAPAMHLLPALLLLTCTHSVAAASLVSPHALFGLVSSASVVSFALWLKRGGRRLFDANILLFAVVFVTYEYAYLLLPAYAVAVAFSWRDIDAEWRRTVWRQIGRAALLVFAATFVLWPGGWLAAGVLKSAVYFAYFVIARGDAVGAQSFPAVWLQRILDTPLHAALILVALALAVPRLRRERWLLPVILFPGIVFLTTVRNTSSMPTYIAPLFPSLFLLVGITFSGIAHVAARWKHAAVLGIGTACVALGFVYTPDAQPQPLRVLAAMMPTRLASGAPVFTERSLMPTLQYYFPGRRFPSFSLVMDHPRDVAERCAREAYATIISAASPQQQPAFERALMHRCTVRKATTIGLFGAGRVRIRLYDLQ